ncbi:MAG: bile acid:sodium symporter [Thermoguttaceae bacterium]|nr:bile acid:sodium symporter [Thermoguttaceae bacterium]
MNKFVLALFAAVLLAWFYPPLGSGSGPLSLTSLAHWGISVIFFFYGLRLDRQRICSGLKNLRLHALTQSATFILFPLLALAVIHLFGLIPAGNPFGTPLSALALGTFFLAALPSTVSSSVVMTNLAGGNVPAAIFNASLSSLAGVFITPIWMRLYLNASTGGSALGSTLLSLTCQVLLPVALGIVLNKRLGWFSVKYDNGLRLFDQSVILLIVYTSFCHSFAERMFDGLSFPALFLLAAVMVLFFFTVYGMIGAAARLLKFNREDRITALYCGSKKSLVHGTVMSAVLLTDPKLAGVLILPTMIYHALQLLIVGILAERQRRALAAGLEAPARQ